LNIHIRTHIKEFKTNKITSTNRCIDMFMKLSKNDRLKSIGSMIGILNTGEIETFLKNVEERLES